MCFQFAICRIPAPVFPSQMLLKITYYLDVISSWCHWSEPTWALLKSRFDEETEFQWKVALMDSSGMPKSRPQLEWFYRRSGTIVGANHTIQSGWYDPQLEEYLAPNLVAEAAIDFGIGRNDDRVRLAIAEAGLLDGRPTSQLAEAIAAAVAAVPELDDKSLNARASSAEIEQRIRATTAEFHALQAPQRPTYVLENEIGDRVVFSGIVTPDPLIATIGAMLADAKAQQDYDKSHEPMPR
jgi:predicted DsbA family dithiol-disulfide isomerase